jgi:hypothetical protein
MMRQDLQCFRIAHYISLVIFSLLFFSRIPFALGQELELEDRLQKIENDVSILKEGLSKDEDITLAFWTALGALISSIATAATVVILVIQTKRLEKSTQLGSGPRLFPRYNIDETTKIIISISTMWAKVRRSMSIWNLQTHKILS